MLVNVYEPLLWYNPPDAAERFTPALATAWSVSDDGRTRTFTLREGVTFHDGEPFNAAAAKSSIERTMELKQGAWYIWSAVESIEAPDDFTLVIRTSQPAPIDLIASSQYGAYMYSPAAAANGTEWFNEGNAAGTGPYHVRQWVRDQQIVLEVRGLLGRVHGAQFRSSDSQGRHRERNASADAPLRREADFISLVPADALAALDADPALVAQAIPSWKNSQFLINVGKAPTDNLDFRRALTHAWDYASVVENIYASSAEVASGIIPATMWGHKADLKAPGFDLEAARHLVEASGIPEGERKVTMAYIGTSEEYKNAALLFQENCRQIGIEVELVPGPWGTIWDAAKNQETAPNLQSMTWWPTYPTPSDWLIGLFRTEDKALFNLSHYANPGVRQAGRRGRRPRGGGP
ncbi:MAG: ABC transporter substrate-binding protein [Gammaproteobacteria bacterium]|nr:ABC transporter substrate-binding protein [Gammaproteobacteria bacterium]